MKDKAGCLPRYAWRSKSSLPYTRPPARRCWRPLLRRHETLLAMQRLGMMAFVQYTSIVYILVTTHRARRLVAFAPGTSATWGQPIPCVVGQTLLRAFGEVRGSKSDFKWPIETGTLATFLHWGYCESCMTPVACGAHDARLLLVSCCNASCRQQRRMQVGVAHDRAPETPAYGQIPASQASHQGSQQKLQTYTTSAFQPRARTVLLVYKRQLSLSIMM